MKNKNKKEKSKINMRRSLALVITGFVFLCILSASIITIVVATIIDSTGNALKSSSTLIYILIALAVSCVIGTIIASILSKFITKQASILNSSIKKVANGDFDVELKPHKTKFMNETIENFNKMIRDLKSVAMLRNDFISNFSHEFKTPIVSINGFAELLKDDKNLTEEQKQEYLAIIVDESARLAKLSQNTLLLSRLETQSANLEMKVFSVDEQIRQIVLLLEKDIKAKNLQIKIKLHKIKCKGNENLTHHIWLNILSNAIKYTKSKITISSQKFENHFVIKVEDDGKGVDEETLNHMFDKYYQGTNASSTMGNGLGLAIAKKVVLLHGGNIEAKNNENEGMAFLVSMKTNIPKPEKKK